jgi:peptide/nickel transport system substrate-binding protein
MTLRHSRLTPGKFVATGVVGLALIAAACGSSSKNTGTGTTTPTTGGGQTTAATTGTTVPVPVNTTSAPIVDKPVLGGKLVVGVEAEVANAWVPANMNCDVACQTRSRTIFEPLASVSADFKVLPYLAESITSNADYTVWTIKARPGVKFHDGTDFNADAMVYNMHDMQKSPLVGPAIIDVTKVEKVDDMTMAITTARSWPGFPIYLASQIGFEASPTWLQSVKDKTGDPTKAVGTGAFVFDSYAPGQSLIVKKNPNYWRKDKFGNQLPYLDSVEMRVIEDEKTRANALKAGDIDIMHTTNGESIVDFRKTPDKFPMIEQAQFGETSYFLLNVGQDGSSLQDQRVRCAANYAIDKKAQIDAVQAGLNTPANGLFSPGQEGYLADTGTPQFDPQKAKDLVAAYTAEKGAPPSIQLGATNDQATLTAVQLAQQNLNDVGFKTEIVQIEQSAYITQALLGNFQMFAWRNHGGVYVDQQYIWWHSKNAGAEKTAIALNFGRVKDPVIDDLLDKARVEADLAKRKADAEAINREFAKQCWAIPVYWTIWGIPHKASVVGIDQLTFPDNTTLIGLGNGFPGQFPMTTIWFKK